MGNLYFFDFGSLGTSCYNHLLYRLFAILFQFFTNVFFQCYPLFLCLSFKDTYSPLLSCLCLLNYAQSELFLLARHTSDCITPAPLCIGAAHARPHRRGGVFRRLLRQSNRNSKRKRHRVAFFPLATGLRLKISRL
jgi:hypothetical protein